MNNTAFDFHSKNKSVYRIAIVIPIHNGLSFTKVCLNNLTKSIGLLDSNDSHFDIVISDDGSTDGTQAWINQNYPDTIVLNGDGNLWWSGGINLCARYAINKLKSDYILFWNNDIKAAPDYFNNLLKIIKDSDKGIIIGSKIFYEHDPTKIWSLGGKFDPKSGQKCITAMGEFDSEKHQKIYDADWLPGMGTIIHHSVFESIGYLDELNFPQYHGDSDFTYRATLAGYLIKVYPELRIWNDKTNSGLMHDNSIKLLFRSLTNIKSSYYLKKDILFYKKHAISLSAYQTLIVKYGLYIGGFIKWKILNLFGAKKNKLKT